MYNFVFACCLSLLTSFSIAQPCSPHITDLVVADDGDVEDGYGWSVAIDSVTAVVGSHRDNARGTDSGSVYILTFDGTQWDQTQKLVPNSIGSHDGFGDCVAIQGDMIVVGSPGDDDVATNSGAAYVFTNIAGAWTLTDKLIAPPVGAGDNYASSVGVDQDVIVLSASLTDTAGVNSGAVYVYRYTNNVWTYEAQLISDDIAQFDRFGIDVAVSGNRILVGADSDDDNGSSSGSVYVFTHDGSQWNQSAKISADDGAVDDQFGERVDISNDQIIVGARYDDDRGSRSGSAYIYEFSGSKWELASKLTAFDGNSSEYFGQDVAIQSGRAIVGAWGQNDRFGFFNAGASYVYSRVNGAWAIEAKVIDQDREGGDFYGYSVDISDDFALVGADGNDDFWWGPDAGSAYIIELDCQDPCLADLNNDGNLNFFDVSEFLKIFASQDLAADFNSDGDLNFFDVSAFLSIYSSGCS